MDTPLRQRDRRLPLAGAVNFRDLGGYGVGGGRQTRWGRVWRSDSLSDLTAADLLQVAALGLHTLIDFRVAVERARRPNRLPSDTRVQTVEIGFVPHGMLDMLRQVRAGALDAAGVEREVLRHYRGLPLGHTGEYTAMFDRLERAAGAPVLIHCTSGKDRTGFGAALILLALGVAADVVVADYALTNHYRRDVAFLFAPQTPPDVVQMLTAAQPKYLHAALEAIATEYGSVDRYLQRGLGVGPVRRARLRDWLTEPADG